jgi:hypothetical protein
VPWLVVLQVKQYLNDPITVDLVGEGQTGKMADSITALAVQVGAISWQAPLGLLWKLWVWAAPALA